MTRFFCRKPRQAVQVIAAATFALGVTALGPTAAAQPVLPVPPEGCVQLDEHGACMPPGMPTDAPASPAIPEERPAPAVLLPDEPVSMEPFDEPLPPSVPEMPVEVEDSVPFPDAIEPTSEIPDEGTTGDETVSEGQPDHGDDALEEELPVPNRQGDHGAPGGGGHGGHEDDHGAGDDHGGGGHQDDDDHGNHDGGHGGGKPGGGHDDDGDHGHGGKPGGDHTENHTNTETNTNVEVKIPITIINDHSVTDNSTHIDNSVTDNSSYVDNSVTTIEKNTYISEVTDIDVQETHVRIGEYTYAERVVYLSEYDRYVRGCEYGGQFVVTAHYPRGVAKQDLPRTSYQRLPEFSEGSTGAGDVVAAPAPASEVVTASTQSHVWWWLGGVVAVGLMVVGCARHLRHRG